MKKKTGKEGIRTKAIVWDISGFMVPCANKLWVFWLLVVFWFWFWLWFFLNFNIRENSICHPWKSIGFPLLFLCSLSISRIFLWPQLIFRSLDRTDLHAQILPLLAIMHLLVGWIGSCRRLRLCWSVKRSVCEEKLHNPFCAFPG